MAATNPDDANAFRDMLMDAEPTTDPDVGANPEDAVDPRVPRPDIADRFGWFLEANGLRWIEFDVTTTAVYCRAGDGKQTFAGEAGIGPGGEFSAVQLAVAAVKFKLPGPTKKKRS